jgi:hypothetical protein
MLINRLFQKIAMMLLIELINGICLTSECLLSPTSDLELQGEVSLVFWQLLVQPVSFTLIGLLLLAGYTVQLAHGCDAVSKGRSNFSEFLLV